MELSIMEQSKILEYLVNIDKRLQKIETGLNKDSNVVNNESDKELKAAGRSNFYNQLKEDLDDRNYSEVQKPRSSTEIKKSSSFNERSVKKPVKIRKSPHTIPSDKAEEKRLERFRQECLSKAIQWNFVDIINSADTDFKIDPPSWMNDDDIMTVLEDTDRKMHLRKFLNLLRERSFVDMKNWINSGLKYDVMKKVWDTYEEFSDHEYNNLSMKCLHHRIIDNVDITLVGDYFHSADIIEKEHNLKIMGSKLPVGTQQGLWKSLFEECSKATNGKIVLGALTIALSTAVTMAGNDEELYEGLHDEIVNCTDVQDILQCHCDEICSRSLHPLSCVKTMSLSQVYISPPTERTCQKPSSESDHSPQSTSSSSIDDSSVDTMVNSQLSEATSVGINIDEDDQASQRKMLSAFEKRRSSSALTRVRKSKKKSNMIVADGDTGSAIKTTVTNQSENTESHYNFKSQPTIITTKNVYIGSGPSYLTKINNNYSHSNTTSVISSSSSPTSSHISSRSSSSSFGSP